MIKKIWGRVVNRETITYLIFGVLTTAVNWAVYGALWWYGTEYIITTSVALVVSVIFAFFVNKLFVFRSYDITPGKIIQELIAFLSCRGLAGGMELVLMIILVSGFHVDELISKGLVSVLVVIVNYIFSKLFIFKNKPCSER